MITDTHVPTSRSESDLRRFDLIGAALAVLMVLGPLMTGAVHG